jgi:hypothetical protein
MRIRVLDKKKKEKETVKSFTKKSKRGWLNGAEHYDTGFYKLSQTGELRSREGKKDSMYVDIQLTLADCSRQIHLNFDCMKKTDIDVRLKKVRALQNVLKDIETTLLECKDENIFK